jgi:glucan-binding YG repeat protein
MATVSAADGWNQDSTGSYYLQGDTRLTGLQTLGGATYYFNANGYRTSGPVTIGNTTYYFRSEDGKLYTGMSGLYQGPSADVLYYFNSAKNGTLVTNQWIKTGGRYYYADATGQIKLGTITVGGKLYHITKEGRLTSYKQSSYNGKYYYANASGVLKTGIQKISGKQYYFNPLTGERQTGTIKVGKYTYYFNTSTGAAKKGWVSLTDSSGEKKYYYYNSKYRRVTGFKTIKGKKYYLDPNDNGARLENGWCKIGGKTYYFNAKGVVQSGFVKINGKTYYTSSSGTKKKGWQTINGRRYYFAKKTGVMQTGWYTSSNNHVYYLNPKKSSSTYGAATVGWKKISGAYYYFESDGKMHTGWLLDNMRYYYLDKTTGKMYTGSHTIDGKTYNFGSSGSFAANISGSYSVKVNRKKNFVVIYKGDTPVKAFVCSTASDGTSTPTGTFKILDKLRWHELMGPSWGQYCSHITSDILFHSVTYSQMGNIHTLSASGHNKLGSPASHGCIRLTVASAKWMYDNLPIGTTVTISDSVPTPKYVPIEQAVKIPLTQNYDPTDPAI